ncbi:hypothetical protein [Roseovarius rhodophyticola]|uniref:Uncharacterized protein n=1 Tax=Roseovarius rhodophyticola TaxID=3080827 RepID=A0ABZ2TL78_9RHOB|nr:hypothetical protein [Roseovarius sp. W115]MDV2929492.1 hypothetical protein [Roseovarius sp. W115]
MFRTTRKHSPAVQNQVLDRVVATFTKPEPLELFAEEGNRAACFGEALHAISTHVGEDMVSPPDQAILRPLEVAYRKMKTVWGDFSPQDFTLYAMSLLLAQLEDKDEIRRFRRGAAKYLLETKSQIAPEFQKLTLNAEILLKSMPAAPKSPWELIVSGTQATPPICKDLDRSAVQLKGSDSALREPKRPAAARTDNNIYRRSTIVHKRNHLRVVQQDAAPAGAGLANDTADHPRASVALDKSENKAILVTTTLALLVFAALILAVLFFVEIPSPTG